MRFSNLAHDRRGNVAMLAAGAGALVCMAAALAIDLGSIALDARRLQGAADLSAMAAATNLTMAESVAQRTAIANTAQPVSVEVELGRYQNDKTLAPSARFQPGATDVNAVRTTLEADSPLFFGAMILRKQHVRLRRTATASAPEGPAAVFSIGSRLASLDGGLANQLLSGLTGSSVSLNLMDYRGLAEAQVELLTYADALSTELGLEVGDYKGLLDHEIQAGRALSVLETVAGPQSSSALSRLSAAAARQNLRIGSLIAVESGDERVLAEGLKVSTSALDIAMAIIEIGAGDRQVDLNLGAQAGLADLKVRLAIGERPNQSGWITVARNGQSTIRTAQARIALHARTAQKLSGLAQVDLPLMIELAASEARLDQVGCNGAPSAIIGVRPGLAQAYIGSVSEKSFADFKTPLAPTPASLLSVGGLVSIKAQAHIEAADKGFTPLSFSSEDIRNRQVRSIQTSQLATSLTSSLLQRLNLDVDVIGLGLGLGGLAQAVGVLLAPIGPVLDNVLNPLFEMLGLKFGEADVRVHDVSCSSGRVRLVS